MAGLVTQKIVRLAALLCVPLASAMSVALAPAACAQSRDSSNPMPLDSNQLQGEVEPGGQSYYYTFAAGPGDLTVSFDGETDFMSTSTRVVLTDTAGRELANVLVSATGNRVSKSAVVHLARPQTVRMQLMFGVDVGVHLKYKVRLAGPLSQLASRPASAPTTVAMAPPPSSMPPAPSNFAQPSNNSQPSNFAPPGSIAATASLATALDLSGSRGAGSVLTGVNGGVNQAGTIGMAGAGSLVGASTARNTGDGLMLSDDASRDAVSTPIEDKWAFVVGVSKFAAPNINLKYPAKDAKDLASYLVNEANFAPDHVKLLTDEQATKERVLAELGDKWLPRLAHPNDLVLIFISTHGSPSQADLEGLNYLVMHNTDPYSLYATGLPLSDLAAAIKHRVHSNRVVLIIDACHSGAADTAKGLARVGNVDSVSLAQGTGQLIICSSQPNQVSWESKRYQNGVFTHQLIEALRAQSGKSTLSQAFDRLRESVQNEVLQDRSELQTAVLKSKWSGNDLIISTPPTKPRAVPRDIDSLGK